VAWGERKSKSVQTRGSLPRPAGLSNLPLFFLAVLLSGLGLLVIYSASAILGSQKFGDGLYYVKKQAVFLGAGWLLYFVVAQISVIRLCKLRLSFIIVSLLLLLSVFIPGWGVSAGGATRWISLGFVQFQPAEFVRLMIIFYLAGTLAFRRDRLNSFNKGFLPLLVVTSILMFILILQPDFGSAMGIFMISLALWFVGGVPVAFLAGLLVLSMPAIVFLIYQASYRALRLASFLDPWKDPQGSGFQVIQSFTAFYQGGWAGVGLGNGQQKLFYLPEAHTDFIFSVIGEELGIVGAVLVVGLFVSLLIMGSRIARAQASLPGYLLATGLTVFFVLPALLNMMVTLGLLPTKGLPLPFFSYGGSSLVAALIALGSLQSLHRRRDEAW